MIINFLQKIIPGIFKENKINFHAKTTKDKLGQKIEQGFILKKII